MKRRIARGLLFASLAVAIVAVRVIWSSASEWSAAESAKGDDRVVHLGRAARLYAPGNPFSSRAFLALAELGRSTTLSASERLSAWRELRAACLATRSFYTPHAALLDEANRAIAAQMAHDEDPALDPGASEEQRRAWHAARLAMNEAPAVGWSVLAIFGFLAWVGAAFAFIRVGLDAEDRLRKPHAIWCAAGIAAGLIAFFLGLARA